ncbi:hypothetical protein KY290_036597 [Solanum tuberosum]|uniref:Uncharacterized protein n=1 Tax=Solanum tuberosum TaxID=4113 RepID=A0ABQ7TT59_SOLTU|nr:hypothetical protein KY289_036084 [Solanum tuberosum]KAH0639336.1 hypothetical protein KY285_035922 [Solanum tuberosum]KAH0737892.1 hypothetical protein KY290_036597 [Solanum tuberosum]
MSLQGYSLISNVFMENQEVPIVVQHPSFMPQIAPEGMRMVIESYNNHLWISSMLHPPLNYQFPIMPFFYIPTWEFILPIPQQILSPMETQPFHLVLQNLQNMEPLFHHWMSQGLSQGYPFFPAIIPSGLMGSTRDQVPSNIPTTSRLPLPVNLVLVQPENANTQEMEEALKIMREERTKITVLKEAKVMVYQEKFDKKFILVCPSNISKILIDIMTPFNPDIGNYILVMNPIMNNNPNVSTMTRENLLVVTHPA